MSDSNSESTMKQVTPEDGQITDVIDENVDRMKRLFPEVFTEGGVNFETLRQLLGDAGVLDEDEEKYGLNWHGKKKARQIALTPSTGTLLPCPEESVDWDTTKNIFIEGDNLEVLKLLQKSYANKIKMIYIDPPYNKDKDFIYPDKFSEGLDTYLKYTGQKSDLGDWNVSESGREKAGRKHTNWLNMICPRLILARSLLSDDGVIVVSIDESEHANLVKTMENIFGEENFCGEIIWKNSSKNDQDYISIQHEYFVVFVKNKSSNKGYWLERKEGLDEIYKAFEGFKKNRGNDWEAIHKDALEWFNQFPDSNPIRDSKHYSWMDEKGIYFPDNISGPNVGQYVYDVQHPITKKNVKPPSRGWFCPPEKMKQLISDNGVHFGSDETTVPCLKTYLKNTEMKSLTSMRFKDGRAASKRLRALFGENIFTNPKDEELLAELMKAFSIGDNDLVLDFFAGSGSTLHATTLLNIQKKSSVRCILVQLPEDLVSMEKSAAGLSKKIISNSIDYLRSKNLPLNICEIAKERIRLVRGKCNTEGHLNGIDSGFKVFKLNRSNIKAWNPRASDIESSLLAHHENLVGGRSELDILYELLIKRGVDLSAPIESRKAASKNIYSIGYGALFACLDESISREQVEDVAQAIIDWHKELAPVSETHVFFRDSAFRDDVSKTNMAAILEQNGINHVRSL
ncbi:DNA methylase N-4/N-6 domain protein [Nitrosomonas sp. Is79A3]|uniref:DNA methyltransferase n=1 Tax=Nitrosomonas sp. (strain Is79A3) TaxID=261292 RepID=UPI000215D374